VPWRPADKQFQPADLKRLLGEINQVDFVTGYRVHRPVPGWLSALDFCWHWLARLLFGYETERRDAWLGWSGWGRRWLARWIFGLRVNDAECVFRLARREVFRRIPIQSRSALAHFEVLAKANHLGAWIGPGARELDRAESRAAGCCSAAADARGVAAVVQEPDFSLLALREVLSRSIESRHQTLSTDS